MINTYLCTKCVRQNGSRPVEIPYDDLEFASFQMCDALLDRCSQNRYLAQQLGDSLVYSTTYDTQHLRYANKAPVQQDLPLFFLSITSTGQWATYFENNELLCGGRFVISRQNEPRIEIFVNGELSLREISRRLNDVTPDRLGFLQEQLFLMGIYDALCHEFTHFLQSNIISSKSKKVLQEFKTEADFAKYINSKDEITALKQEIFICCKNKFKNRLFRSTYATRPSGVSDFLIDACVSYSQFEDLLTPKHKKEIISLAYQWLLL